MVKFGSLALRGCLEKHVRDDCEGKAEELLSYRSSSPSKHGHIARYSMGLGLMEYISCLISLVVYMACISESSMVCSACLKMNLGIYISPPLKTKNIYKSTRNPDVSKSLLRFLTKQT